MSKALYYRINHTRKIIYEDTSSENCSQYNEDGYLQNYYAEYEGIWLPSDNVEILKIEVSNDRTVLPDISYLKKLINENGYICDDMTFNIE